MELHINGPYLVVIALACLLAYHVAYRMAVILRDPSLVYWSVGPLGVSAVTLRRPRTSLLFAQFVYGALAMASALYLLLFVAQPAPIGGLTPTGETMLLAVAAPVGVMTFVALFAQIRARRYPLWGEARVLSAAQRSLALGSALFFTPLGRAFLHDRFNATPSEFIQIIRS
ncbi:MAG TPA: hypothetical protein VF808_12435 [Ktedonobacterales bacterium]